MNSDSFGMGKKRERSFAEEDVETTSESMDDSEEEITFDPMTKEQRKKQEQFTNSDDGEDDEGDDDDVDTVNVEFEFSDPKEEHFKSVRNFFRYLFLGSAKDIDFSPLADAVVKQVEVGSMVQISGEDDVYAFLTLLNLQYYKVRDNNEFLVIGKSVYKRSLEHSPQELSFRAKRLL